MRGLIQYIYMCWAVSQQSSHDGLLKQWAGWLCCLQRPQAPQRATAVVELYIRYINIDQLYTADRRAIVQQSGSRATGTAEDRCQSSSQHAAAVQQPAASCSVLSCLEQKEQVIALLAVVDCLMHRTALSNISDCTISRTYI